MRGNHPYYDAGYLARTIGARKAADHGLALDLERGTHHHERRQRKEDPSGAWVTCWCEQTKVWVTWPEIWQGQTRNCPRIYCAPGYKKQPSRIPKKPRKIYWVGDVEIRVYQQHDERTTR